MSSKWLAGLLLLAACSRIDMAGVYSIDGESVKRAAKAQGDAMQAAMRGSKIKDIEQKIEKDLGNVRAELVLEDGVAFSRTLDNFGDKKSCSGTYGVEGGTIVLTIAEEKGQQLQPPRVERLEIRDGGIVLKDEVPFEMRLVRK